VRVGVRGGNRGLLASRQGRSLKIGKIPVGEEMGGQLKKKGVKTQETVKEKKSTECTKNKKRFKKSHTNSQNTFVVIGGGGC